MSDTPRTFGSLFAGIGGIDLGLERSGLQCQWQVEIDPYCQKILKKHWPDVPLHDDVKTFPPNNRDAWQVDLIAAGFPCTDISIAGREGIHGKGGQGIHGKRSSLFFDVIRVARYLRPRWLLLENVPALLAGRGMGTVLQQLAEAGYNARWCVLSAASVGAPHRRLRLFIRAELADANSTGLEKRKGQDTDRSGENGRTLTGRGGLPEGDTSGPVSWGHSWDTEPTMARVAAGVPNRVERTTALGNAVVPQCIEELCRQWGWVAKAHSIPGDESEGLTDDCPPRDLDPKSQSQ